MTNRPNKMYELPNGGWVRLKEIVEISDPKRGDDGRWRVFLHGQTGQRGRAEFETEENAQEFADDVAAAIEADQDS